MISSDGSNSPTTQRKRKKTCLKLHIFILKLAPKNPTLTQAKLTHTTSIDLGCCTRDFTQQLPFQFLWKDTELYFTMSAARLRVYRITLPSEIVDSLEDQTAIYSPIHDADRSAFKVFVPKETIFLPRSACNRSVQFIPGRDADASSTLVLGPRQGFKPTPPVVVTLKADDLGPWIPPAEKAGEEARQRAGFMRLKGQFEDFDNDSDCDIIPI
jgi:hypothetical protein